MNNRVLNILVIISLVFLFSCTQFLEIKPDKKMTTPESLEDIQAILDNVNYLNTSYAPLSEESSDTYYLLPSVWSALPTIEQRNEYLINHMPVSTLHWAIPYRAVFTANTAIDALDNIKTDNYQLKEQLYGIALFHRSRYFLNLVDVFAKTYSKEHLNEPGIVLKLNADINEESVRSTIKETYDRIILDLKQAANLLSIDKPPYPTRPNKLTAYAVLAQTYLVMQDYENALQYADSCLSGLERISIEDYNLLPNVSGNPFKRHGEEVLFYSRFTSVTLLTTSRANIDTVLLALYDDDDLRKTHFFSKNANGTYFFKGDFSLNTGATYFNGITIPEILLIRAECYARRGNLENARKDLELLLEKRYKPGRVPNLNILTSSKDFVDYIITERRKELVFRGVRWSDLRRLSTDPQFAKGVERLIDGKKYGLSSSEIYKYAHKLPEDIIENSMLKQN
jgi:tetratricopeptide (TPR) repeat protein